MGAQDEPGTAATDASALLRGLADELEHLAGGGTTPGRLLVGDLAVRGRQVAEYLAERGPEGLWDDVQELAREQPVALAAAAVAASLAIEQFAEAGRHSAPVPDTGFVPTVGADATAVPTGADGTAGTGMEPTLLAPLATTGADPTVVAPAVSRNGSAVGTAASADPDATVPVKSQVIGPAAATATVPRPAAVPPPVAIPPGAAPAVPPASAAPNPYASETYTGDEPYTGDPFGGGRARRRHRDSDT